MRQWCWAVLLLCLGVRISAGELPPVVEVNGVEFVHIPGGTFWYTVENGVRFNYKPASTPYYRQVQIRLDGFYMARYEARARDLVRFMNSGAAPADLKAAYLEEWTSTGAGEKPSGSGCTVTVDEEGRFRESNPAEALPATYLSWTHAQAFARWMGFRLPTEAEWQRAARGDDQRIWPWGSEYPDDARALFGFTRSCQPDPVIANSQGRSPYGLLNMAGNVSEYVQDWFNEHWDAELQTGAVNPPLAEVGSEVPHEQPKRIRKGGRWSHNAAAIAIGYRQLAAPGAATNRDGVRFAIDERRVAELLARGEAIGQRGGTEQIDE